jgi:hypothetical protein
MERKTINLIVGILVLTGLIMALFWIFKSIATLLTWIAPILLILTLIIDRKVIFNYGKMLVSRLKNDFLMGLVLTILTVIGFPFVTAFLFFKAMLNRKVRKMTEQADNYGGDYVGYQEIEEDTLELPELPPKEPPAESQYEELFD